MNYCQYLTEKYFGTATMESLSYRDSRSEKSICGMFLEVLSGKVIKVEPQGNETPQQARDREVRSSGEKTKIENDREEQKKFKELKINAPKVFALKFKEDPLTGRISRK